MPPHPNRYYSIFYFAYLLDGYPLHDVETEVSCITELTHTDRGATMTDDGMIRFYCSECGKRNKVLAKFSGMGARCPKCGTVNIVPSLDDDLDVAEDELRDLANHSGGMSVNADVQESDHVNRLAKAPEEDLLAADAFGNESLSEDAVLEFLDDDDDDEVFDMFAEDESEK